ncbi:hypothetical protein D3C87_2171650 [compost metagenome]
MSEAFAIGGDFFLRLEMRDAGVCEAAQLLRDARQLGCYRRILQAWGAQDARLHQRAAVLRR